VLAPGAQLDYRWGVQGWLLAPEPSVGGADLESWLTAGAAAAPGQPTVSFSRTGLAPVRMLQAPRQAWLLLCSALVLALGLGLYLAPLSRGAAGAVLLLFGLAAVAGAWWFPAALPPVVFGCQPGLVVLALLLGAQWLLQERYRRQIVFLPGFARLQANSSLARAAQARKPREASTVDSPGATGSATVP